MAPRKPVAPAASTELANWDEELAREAAAAAATEANAGGSEFFSLKAGVLSFGGNNLDGNQMAAVIVDSTFENVYYEGDYDPDNPQPPMCFAFARDESELAPHPTVVEAGNAQHETCKGCPHNEWGSADKGRGKACRNTRRLALLPAGTFKGPHKDQLEVADEDYFEKAPFGMLRLPVTSVKPYANFVKQVAGVLRRPPYSIITRIHVVPDAKTQFQVQFEPLLNLSNSMLPIIKQRREEAGLQIANPYPIAEEVEGATPPPKRGARPAPSKAVAKAAPARGARKY